MRAVAFAVVVVAVLLAASRSRGQDPPPNPVQQEMRLLEEAMRDAVTAIAKGDVRGLPKQLHAVHTAADKTKQAAGSGAYAPPKNPEQLAAFRALDEAFHQEMILMVKAARRNDVSATSELFGKLMVRCHACHAQFRGP